MSADKYRNLWDGSEPGWTLQRYDRIDWSISFHFPESGTRQSDILALRKLLDEFRDIPLAQVLEQLRGRSVFTLPYELGNLKTHWLMDATKKLELNATADSIDRGGYLAISPECSAVLIEDEDVYRKVAERMIAAGVPVTEVHVD